MFGQFPFYSRTYRKLSLEKSGRSPPPARLPKPSPLDLEEQPPLFSGIFLSGYQRPKAQLLSFTGMAKLELLTSLLPSLSGLRARSGFTECLACQASSWCRGCFCELNRCMLCPAELKVHLVVETGSEQTSPSLPRSARKQTDRNKKVVYRDKSDFCR